MNIIPRLYIFDIFIIFEIYNKFFLPNTLIKKEIKRLHINRTKPAQWITKHQAKEKTQQKSLYPDQGTYNPIPINCMTFAKIYKENKGLVKGKKTDSHYFGKIERFGNSNKKKKAKVFQFQDLDFIMFYMNGKGKKAKTIQSLKRKLIFRQF